MTGTVRLVATTNEPLKIPLRSDFEPTAPPEFSVTGLDDVVPGAWLEGEWISEWNTRTGWRQAQTPVFSPAGPFVIGLDTYLQLWARVTAGAKVGVSSVGVVHVPGNPG